MIGRLILYLFVITSCWSCQRDLTNETCSSLVASSTEAICLLPKETAPLSLVGSAAFRADGSITLREKLASLKGPMSHRDDSYGVRWQLFEEQGARFEAACVPGRSVEEDTCFWHLRAGHPVDVTGFDGRLMRLLGQVRAAGLEKGVLQLTGANRPDGSRESLTLEVESGQVRSIDWYDPSQTKDLKVAWYSP